MNNHISIFIQTVIYYVIFYIIHLMILIKFQKGVEAISICIGTGKI